MKFAYLIAVVLAALFFLIFSGRKKLNKLEKISLHRAIYESADEMSKKIYKVPFMALPDGWARFSIIKTAKAHTITVWHMANINRQMDDLSAITYWTCCRRIMA